MPTREPLAVVNERMAAYNTHDMPAFLAAYSPEVAIYRYPDRLLGTGHTHLSSSVRRSLCDEGRARGRNATDRAPGIRNQ